MIDVGLIIMAVGMLVVFAFLAIMVFSMRFMSSFILKFFPEKEMRDCYYGVLGIKISLG